MNIKKLNIEVHNLFLTAVRNTVFLLCVLVSTISIGQVDESVDRASIKIGEEIIYSIKVEADTSATVVFPDGQTFLPLEVIEFYDIDTTFEQAKYRLIKKYGLTQFDSGRYIIPRQQVRINEQIFYTDSLLVEVADVVVDTLTQKMFDIKPLMDVPPGRSDWYKNILWILLAILIIGGIIYLLVQRKKRIAEAKKQLPPYEEALVALQELDTSEYLKNNQVKDYYSSLTEIVKRYLDREVDEAALESTTDELIEKLNLHKDSGHLDFDRATIEKLNQILKRADLIKFAKMQMESGQAQLDRKEIESIINETHDAIPEPTEEELLKDALYREVQQKKRKRRKTVLFVGSAVTTVLVAVVVLISFFGVQTVRDSLFGNYTKNLAEGQWVKSEYGYPAITLETPEVLKRIDPLNLESDDAFETFDGAFTYGDIQKKLFIMVASSRETATTPTDLENILERKLLVLESRGATNLIIRDEPFTTEEGVTGIKGFGEFNVQVSANRYKKVKSEYELLIFAQNGSVQEILIVHEKEDLYAQQIKERILRSVELEIVKN